MILLALSVAWLVGLGLSAAGLDRAWLFAMPFWAGIAGGLALGRRTAGAVLALAALALLVLGSLRFEAARPPASPGGIAAFNGAGAIQLRGVVDGEPERRETSQRLVLRAEQADAGSGWQATSGRVLVTLPLFPDFDYGDRLEMTASLEAPPVLEAFDYQQYLARRGIASTAGFPAVRRLEVGRGSPLKAGLIDVRRRLGSALSRALPEPEAALSRGMLLGQRTSIPASLNEDFNTAGISHLIAISGSNVTIVAGLVLASLSWLIGRRRAAVLAMLFIAGFVVLVGASPSVVRAGVMGVMMLGAVLAGRPGGGLTAVAVAGALLTAVQPLSALDVSFQLSFAATLGLVVLEPPLRRALVGPAAGVAGAAGAFIAESISVTAAASLAVLPITAANFERVSLIAVPANVLAVPLFTATILLSALTSLCGLVSGDAGHFAGDFAYVPLGLLIWIARAFASVPLATLRVSEFGLAGALGAYAALGLVGLIVSKRPTFPLPVETPRLRFGLTATASLLIAVAGLFLWADALRPASHEMEVFVLDVGQGDAILVVTPTGQRILIDGGPSGPALLRDLASVLPRGERRIDLMVLTHPQEDHVAGLVDVARQYRVRAAAISGTDSQLGAYSAWRTTLRERGIPVETVRMGEVAGLGHGVSLEVLSPNLPYLAHTEDDFNNNAVVLRLAYREVSFLLTADLGPEGEARLLSETGALHATVLKVGHHGSATSTSDAFLEAVRPAVAVISVGEDNTYGHPSPTTLLRLAGVPLYRTDHNGTVRFETDGRHLFVKPDRGDFHLVPISAR